MRSLILASAFCLVAACDTAVDAPDAALTDPGGWTLQSPPSTDETDLYVVFRPDGTFSAHATCNVYSGPFRIQGGQIDLLVEGGTRVNCGGVRGEIEDAFVRGLGFADTFEIDGRELSIDGRGVSFESGSRVWR